MAGSEHGLCDVASPAYPIGAVCGRSRRCATSAGRGIPRLEAALPGLTEKLEVVQQGRAFAREMERLQATEIRVTTLGEVDYPEALRWIPEPPPVLYIWGTLRHEDSLAVAVVGSRKPSPYG